MRRPSSASLETPAIRTSCRANGSCAVRRGRWMTFARWAAIRQRTSGDSPPPRGFRRSIFHCTAPSCSRWSRRSSRLRSRTGCIAGIRFGCPTRPSPTTIRSCRCWQVPPRRSTRSEGWPPRTTRSSPCRRRFQNRSSARSMPGGRRREKLSEQIFLAVYGMPALQAAVGIDPAAGRTRRPGKSPLHRELVEKRIAELKAKIDKGGLQECTIRGLIYIGAARGAVDERGVAALRRIRLTEEGSKMTLAQFKAMAREQFFLLLLEPEATLAAIPKLLPSD